MDTYKVKFTSLIGDAFRLLCIKAGETLSQRQIANMLNISPTAAATAIRQLEKAGLARAEKSRQGNIRLISLNRDSIEAIALKRAENFKQISESGLVWQLPEQFPGAAIVLFGSYSRGEDVTSSDIDIAVIGAKEKGIELSLFETALERKIVLQFYKSLGAIHKNLRENLINGIVLYGIVEL
ncbi:MAG: nucleotidyltransferase domain-containing protein [Nanoarchaeota archaeon]|nr:nucleotidyltransferase domain-containing protein [Nanoarchaeota archaeon]